MSKEKKSNGARGVYVKCDAEQVAAILKIQQAMPIRPSFGGVVRAAVTAGLKTLGK